MASPKALQSPVLNTQKEIQSEKIITSFVPGTAGAQSASSAAAASMGATFKRNTYKKKKKTQSGSWLLLNQPTITAQTEVNIVSESTIPSAPVLAAPNAAGGVWANNTGARKMPSQINLQRVLSPSKLGGAPPGKGVPSAGVSSSVVSPGGTRDFVLLQKASASMKSSRLEDEYVGASHNSSLVGGQQKQIQSPAGGKPYLTTASASHNLVMRSLKSIRSVPSFERVITTQPRVLSPKGAAAWINTVTTAASKK